MALYKVTKKQSGGGSTPTVFSVNASHPNNPTTYDIVVTVGGSTVFSKNYSCTIYGVFAQDTDTFTYNGTTYTVLAQGYQANNGQKMLDVSIDNKSYSVYCSKTNSSYATDDTFTLIVGGGIPAPKLLSAQSHNTSTIGSLTYTFTEGGVFQYYAFIIKSSTAISTDVTVKLNGVAITPILYLINGVGFFYGNITINANDVISIENTNAISNCGMQLFILQNADVSNFNLIGYWGNDGSYSALNTGDSFYLNIFQCGYWGTNNHFNCEIGRYGNRSVATPNESYYYYGFTYIITI